MTVVAALVSFSLAALLVTLAPGIDTALVLRTTAVDNRDRALCAGLGIVTGVFAWGLIAACGLGALLAISQTAYRLLLAGRRRLPRLARHDAVAPGPQPRAKQRDCAGSR